MKKVIVGADHRGYKMKTSVIEWLVKNGWEYEDMGAYSYDEEDDFTLYAEKVSLLVSSNKSYFGILLCGSGVGMGVVANKIDGVYAGLGKDVSQVKAGRRDDDMNVLVISADTTLENEVVEMVETFLTTEFDGKARHKRRITEIKRLEVNN